MKIHDVKQGSADWLILRSGIPTASEMDALLTPKFKVKTGDGPRTYLCKKLAEAWQGGPLMSTGGSFAMDQGHLVESEAIPWYSLEFNREIKRVGFITTDNGKVGCSPDGLIEIGGKIVSGLEVKCPQLHTQVGYVLEDVVPDEYVVQVHTSMYVTGLTSWTFLSYRRMFPPVVITVDRNEEYQEKIDEALNMFHENFSDAMAMMERKNGGPSKARWTPPPIETQEPSRAAGVFVADENDVPT